MSVTLLDPVELRPLLLLESSLELVRLEVELTEEVLFSMAN